MDLTYVIGSDETEWQLHSLQVNRIPDITGKYNEIWGAVKICDDFIFKLRK